MLKRKADIICKCFSKLENRYGELIKNLVDAMKAPSTTPEEDVKRKVFALYNFEVLAEYHLSQELIVENSAHFVELFAASLEDPQVEIKVASLKAITSFLSSIEDTENVLTYKSLATKLLQVVIEVLNRDEEQGRASLEHMIELTHTHGDIWGGAQAMLLTVISEIMKNRNFEDETRQSALEIVVTLSENMAGILRKHIDELKS